MDDKAKDIETALLRLNDLLLESEHQHVAAAINSTKNLDSLHTILSSMLVNASIRYVNQDLLHDVIQQGRVQASDFADVKMPVGLVSSDSAAILGRQGVLFLIAGSNDVLGQYASTFQEADALFEKWKHLISARMALATQRSVHLHHIVMPEKISIVPDLFPAPIMGSTRLLDMLDKHCQDTYGKILHTSARSVFWRHTDKMQLIKKFDSHLSPFGTFLVFKELLNSTLDVEVAPLSFTQFNSAIGDLCYRMFGLFLPECFLEVDSVVLPEFCKTAIKVSEVSPDSGAHMGRRQVWQNPSAPIKKKALIFGNSYSSIVENGQSNLSWWFSRWFEEYHFVWTNEIDWDYVDDVRPNLIVWQGTERFLPVVPGQ